MVATPDRVRPRRINGKQGYYRTSYGRAVVKLALPEYLLRAMEEKAQMDGTHLHVAIRDTLDDYKPPRPQCKK